MQRQYAGTAGRIEDCQIGVFLGYTSRLSHTLIDRAHYLPESWTKDRARCAEAGVPPGTGFATKPALGCTLLARPFAAGVPGAWVTGDCVYGSDDRLRRLIEDSGRGYVLAARSNQCFGLGPAADWFDRLTDDDWQRRSAGAGNGTSPSQAGSNRGEPDDEAHEIRLSAGVGLVQDCAQLRAQRRHADAALRSDLLEPPSSRQSCRETSLGGGQAEQVDKAPAGHLWLTFRV